jgi:hypothetical protein
VRPFVRLAAVLAVALIFEASCDTVDVGPETGPPAGCNAKAPFFVSDVWPKYFDAYMCGKSDCHDASSGHGYFRLQSLASVTPPNPMDSLALWPEAWRANLRAVEQNVSCGNPTSSLVLTVPEGRGQPHPPGTVVTDPAGADALFRMWLH